MDIDIFKLGQQQYRRAIGVGSRDYDEDGFYVLRPTASHVDARKAELTTSLDDLEAQMRKFREEKAALSAYQKTDEYRESKKRAKEKKGKKSRETLLAMMFNNADAVEQEQQQEDEENYRDIKKRKPKTTTLDTTYGKRFSPVVSLLHDTIDDFDRIAAEIQEELDSPKCQGKTMYRSNQIGNLISAKNSKLSAVKELGSIAKTVSDLEYKKDKDKKATEGSDTTKAISSLGAKFLQGTFGLDDDRGSKSNFESSGEGKGKKDKKKKKKLKAMGSMSTQDDDDDDTEDEMSVVRPSASLSGGKSSANTDQELANAFANEIMGRKKEFSFTPYERNLSLEGKYAFVVVCSAMDPEHTFRFMAIDPKTGKELKDFKEDHKELYPKKKQVRLRFDLAKKQAVDLNSGKKYKLYFND